MKVKENKRRHFNRGKFLPTLVVTAGIIGAGLVSNRAFAVGIDLVRGAKGVTVHIVDGTNAVFMPINPGVELGVVEPTSLTESRQIAVHYSGVKRENGEVILSGGEAPGLTFTETFRVITPNLIQRVVQVTALRDQRYYLELGWKTGATGDFYSFPQRETASHVYSSCSGPAFHHDARTFPLMGYKVGNHFFGLIGDTPGLWENRSFLRFEPDHRYLSLQTGDGSPERIVTYGYPVMQDSDGYRARFDGWQHLEMGKSATFTTWIFDSPAHALYDIQLAAELALANAKGWNGSALEAIMKDASYLLLRRNLLHSESDYIFVSGPNYGWKQWVSDGFMASLGLDDPKYNESANYGVFLHRTWYEDNSQYYLIWSTLVKRAGGHPNHDLIKDAYKYLRDHEHNGLYIPFSPNQNPLVQKTYQDSLPYADGDAPSSDQCLLPGAFMGAKELGLPVTDQQIQESIDGFRRMFNTNEGYMATSLMQQDHVGQDALLGETLTYAVFGKKLLTDDMVRQHLETSVRIQSPYGMRCISAANGDLYNGMNGVYAWGGSWFLYDGANYLDGLIHGMDPKWIEKHLLWRLEKELAWTPTFHESISTVNGKPYGNIIYGFNSGFYWMDKEVRKRLGLPWPDPVEEQLDRVLGVVHEDGYLALDPDKATLRPPPDVSWQWKQ